MRERGVKDPLAYELHFLRYGRVTQRLTLNCRTDRAALEKTLEHFGSQDLQLWSGQRLVATIMARPERRTKPRD